MYHRLAKEGPWVVHLTLGSDGGWADIRVASLLHFNAKERPVFPGEAHHADDNRQAALWQRSVVPGKRV